MIWSDRIHYRKYFPRSAMRKLLPQVESLILIGISTLGKHSTFLGTLPLLTGIQFCGGILLVPVTLCIFGLARKEREFLTTRKYFLALILAYAIILGVQVCVPFFLTSLQQGGPTGRGTLFVDIKLKAPLQYKLLILKSYFNVNKSLSSTRWTTLYFH